MDDKALRRHMSNHRQPSDYPCTQCGRTFSLKIQLRRHNCVANLRHMARRSPPAPAAPGPAGQQPPAPRIYTSPPMRSHLMPVR